VDIIRDTTITPNSGLTGTPPIPEDLRARPIKLTENARTVLQKRYLRRGEDGKPAETEQEMFWRVAYNVALPEAEFGTDVLTVASSFYDLLTNLYFFPNSPTFTGAGTPLGQLAACFVLPIDDDMGRTEAGIFQTLRNAALIQQTGGGNGFAFSRLRPKGAIVKSSNGQATGPVGFLRVYDQAFGEIAQGGSRRGANMAVLRVDHPDIREFITCKSDESQITNFNISVGITDTFMKAVVNGTTYDLINPRDGSVWETVQAREIFDLIVKYAHRNGEPGVLFLDTANRQNPVPHLYELESTNPCGEQFLGPFENCCLGSINLVNVNTPDGRVDWALLQRLVETSTLFLDDVVSANKYVPAVPQLEKAAHAVRRIGLGIMGLGDLMYKCGIRYGSEEGQEFAGQVMEFVRYHAMKTSIILAKQRGAFPEISGSLYDPKDLKWQPPQPLAPYTRNWGRPAINWADIVEGIKRYGIRNGAQTTVAPTGTIATVSGCEAYGCEPVFALAYIRHVNDRGQDLQLQYTSPLFQQALEAAGLNPAQIKTIVEQVNLLGSCQDIAEVPEHVRHTFVVSSDVTAEEHIRMQAAMQAFVDNAISKTCNFPPSATVEDVEAVYKLGWELGCKGLTVYVTGSREKVVLETHATAKAKEAVSAEAPAVSAPEVAAAAVASQPSAVENTAISAAVPTPSVAAEVAEAPRTMKIYGELKKHRPRRVFGRTYQVGTPLGKTYVTINENGDGRGQPFEVFTHTSKAGSETAAVSEAIGRLVSLVLRIASPISPRERLGEIIQQLNGIGGGRSSGFGAARVRSLPDGIAQVLQEYMEETTNTVDAAIDSIEHGYADHHDDHDHVDLDTPVQPNGSAASLSNRATAFQNGGQAATTAPSPRNGVALAAAITPAPGVSNGRIVGDLCPDCGEATLINEEGCRKCYTCGYSEC
jgi:ribonucleoside-diphosphate reductase alpha chain